MTKLIIVIMIVPLTLIVSGAISYLRPPKNANSLYGFRTRLASRTAHTWIYANRKSAQLFIIFGAASLLANLILYFLLAGENTDSIVKLLAYVSIGLILLALLSNVLIVQFLLKKKFDERGFPKVIDSI